MIMFALAIVPIFSMAGFAIDYAQGIKHKARISAAADSAALEAVITARSDSMANKSDSTAIADGIAQAQRAFSGNIAGISSISAQPLNVSLARSGQTFTAVVTYTATSKMFFSNFLKVAAINLGGSSTASVDLPPYLAHYLLLDVSGSMGIPSTTAGQTRLASINPDNLALYPTGCNFACHFAGYQGYDLSRTNGTGTRVANDYCPSAGQANCIQLRLDAVAYAVQQLLQTAQTTALVANQFSVGLFPFITHMLAYQPQTTTLSTVSTMATNLPSLLDVGTSPNSPGNLGSGGTHFDNALTEVNAAITAVGDGSSAASRQPFVFLVTDGAQDNQYQAAGSWWGSNSATTVDPTYCTTLKNRGITLAILYVPYVPIANPNPSFANDEDDYANWNVPHIPPALSTCASPNFFFTANTPTDIANALQAMFALSVKSARLTH